MIYTYTGKYSGIINKGLVPEINNSIRLFIWQNEDESLGFEYNKVGIEFVKHLLAGSFTILFPETLIIDSVEKIDEKIFSFRGVSLFGNTDKLKIEQEKYMSYQGQLKRNTLLEQYGKPTTKPEEPIFMNWFVDGQYTTDFITFCNDNNLEFIIWQRSDFGVSFFEFLNFNVHKNVANIASDLEIPVRNISQINEIPFW